MTNTLKNNILNYSALFFLSLIPLFFAIGPAVFDIFILIFSLIFIFQFLINKERIFLNYKLFLILIFIFIYMNIVSFFAQFQEVAFARSISFLRYFIIIIAISNIVYRYSHYLKYTFLCAALLTIFIVLDIIYQFYFEYDIFNNKSQEYRLSGPFGEELIAGQVLFLLSMPSLIFSFIFFKNKRVQILIFIFMIFLLLIGIFFSGQRTSMFNFIFSLFLFFIIFRKDIYLKTSYFIGLIILSITSIFIFFNDIFYRFIIITFKQLSNLFYTSYSAYYETGINVWLDNFWFGAGLKNYRFVCENKLYISKYSGQPCANHPHNSFIEILSELGIFGLIFFLVLFIYFIRIIIIKIVSNNIIDVKNFLPFFITIIPLMFPILPSGSFFTNTHSVPFWLYFAISLSIFYKLDQSTS